jgi:fatty acid desaturase
MAALALAVYSLVIYFSVAGKLALVPAMLINAVMAYILFTPMHEAGHMNVSGPRKDLRWIDELLGWLSGITLFAPFYVFKVIHFRHHAHTNDPEKDPDHWLASKNLFQLIFHSVTIFPVYVINGFKMLFIEKQLNSKVRRELIIAFIVLIIFLVVLGLWISWHNWIYPLMLWILPAVIAQGFLAFAFDWLPHHPHQEQKPWLNTRVFDIPGLSVLLLSQNYHLIHHLHPRIPFYKYKNAYDDVSDKIADKGVDVIQWNSPVRKGSAIAR